MRHHKNLHHHRKINSLLAVLLFLVLALAFIDYSKSMKESASPQKAKEMILRTGKFAPLLFIFMILFIGIFSIIPSSPIIIAGGYLFGPVYGFAYSLMGVTSGSTIMFFLARKLGKGFLLRFVNKREFLHFESFFKKRGLSALVIGRAVPIFPSDIISFFSGITEMSYIHYLFFSLLAVIPSLLVQSFFGDYLSDISLVPKPLMIFMGLLLAAGALIYLFRHRIKLSFIMEVREAEKKFQQEEERVIRDVACAEKAIRDDYKKAEKFFKKRKIRPKDCSSGYIPPKNISSRRADSKDICPEKGSPGKGKAMVDKG